MRLSRLLLMLVVCLLAPAVTLAANRGISVNIRASEDPNAAVIDNVELYDKSFALVIGIDDYSNGWPKLSNAVHDAELIAAELESKGFDVELHKNLKSNELNTVFKRFFILKGDDPNARLFIWFAGHGATVDGEGYIIPADAPTPQQGAEFKYASVALRDFGTFMRQAVSKHAYAVFDSCFAGTVFTGQRALPPSAITRATTLPVRQFLTSGDADQTVSDDGAFRDLFIKAINGDERSDANGDGYVTASELGMFLGDRITNLTQSMQTPRYGKLRDRNFDRGDFVFTLPEGAVANALNTSPTGSAPTSTEVVFWESIKESQNLAEYKAYLQQYPNGSFKTLANLKLRQIAAKQDNVNQSREREKFEVAYLDQDLKATKVANIRQTPFPNAPRVGKLGEGARVWAVGQTRTRGGVWYKIAKDGHELGFVYGPLLASVGRLDRTIAIKPLEFKPDPVQQPQGSSLGALMDQVIATSSDSEQAVEGKFSSLLDDMLVDNTDLAADVEPTTRETRQVFASRGLPSMPDHSQMAPSRQDNHVVSDKGEILSRLPALDRTDIETVLTNSEQEDFAEEAQSQPQVQTLDLSQNQRLAPDSAPSRPRSIQLAAPGLNIEPVSSSPSDAQTSGNTTILSAEANDKTGLTEEIQLANLKPAYTDYIQRYIKVASAGNSKAQLSLAYMFETGQQVQIDKKEAAKWYMEAAKAGEVQAMISLGLLYEAGEGVVPSLSEAAYWYGRAAELGNADAQQTLGFIYEQGKGLVKDEAEAARWYEKAAKQGRMTAQNNLGRLYHLGIGVSQDMDLAIFWYEKAAAQGSEPAKKNLAELLSDR